MKSVAILYVCTGKYDAFWETFYNSYEKFFLTQSLKHYFVFTDNNIIHKDKENVSVIYQKSLGWPGNTLYRYHMFYNILDKLNKYDYIFFMNANCECRMPILEEEILNPNGLTVVKHPGFYDKGNNEYTYDRNIKSTAYIPYNEGDVYICGGVNGGTSESYIELIKELKDRIDKDTDNKVIALWHDESHINRYILDLPKEKYKMISPAFCYPEGWSLPFECKILIRDKSKWIDVDNIKNGSRVRQICRRLIARFNT